MTTSNSDWSNTSTKVNYVSVSTQGPSANFIANPTSGVAPLVVKFTDTSTGSPKPYAWSWDFGDGVTSTEKSPSHTYSSVGTYTVSLTVKNNKGFDTETKERCVTVNEVTITYYAFADGVALYHNYLGNTDLPGADASAQGFYQHLATGPDRCHIDDLTGTNYCWDERSNPVNDFTGSRYWSRTEMADSIGANSAEFAFHAGHGGNDGILFPTQNNFNDVFFSNMSFSRTKWVAFDSCSMLAAGTQTNWESVFDGLHILMGYETVGQIDEDTGPQFVERMKGGTYQGTQYVVTPIRYAWRDTLRSTVQNGTLWGAYMWADPSGDDYLPGYGLFTEPVKTNEHYTVYWEHFLCI